MFCRQPCTTSGGGNDRATVSLRRVSCVRLRHARELRRRTTTGASCRSVPASDQRGTGDNGRDLRKDDAHEPELDDVVVASERGIRLGLRGEECRHHDHQQTGHAQRDECAALGAELRPLAVQRRRQSPDAALGIARAVCSAAERVSWK